MNHSRCENKTIKIYFTKSKSRKISVFRLKYVLKNIAF